MQSIDPTLTNPERIYLANYHSILNLGIARQAVKNSYRVLVEMEFREGRHSGRIWPGITRTGKSGCPTMHNDPPPLPVGTVAQRHAVSQVVSVTILCLQPSGPPSIGNPAEHLTTQYQNKGRNLANDACKN
jgi:hypothetical protein